MKMILVNSGFKGLRIKTTLGQRVAVVELVVAHKMAGDGGVRFHHLAALVSFPLLGTWRENYRCVNSSPHDQVPHLIT